MKPECSIVRDLLPLYAEELTSTESARFIDAHLADCSACRAELAELKEGRIPTPPLPDGAKPFRATMKRMKRQFHAVAYTALIFLIFLGFSRTAGSHLMYNSLIMPLVGMFGYFLFRWRAVYQLPVLLLLIDLALFAFRLVPLSLTETLMWTAIYTLFVLVGIAIAFLLHFALGKENRK